MSQKMVNHSGRSGEMDKVCQACKHPERTAIEEALERGEPYQALAKQFSLLIGAMRRHRKAHLTTSAQAGSLVSRESVRERPGTWVFIRFGYPPKGEISFNQRFGLAEK